MLAAACGSSGSKSATQTLKVEVDGKDATLTIKKEHKDANGTSSESFTQKFAIDPSGCWITH